MTGRRDDGVSDSILAQQVLLGGLFLTVVSVPLTVLLIRAVSGTAPTWLGIVPLPAVEQSVDLFPPMREGGFDVARWLWGVLVDFLGVVFAVVYYLLVFTALLGAGLVLAGGIAISDTREIARTVRRALGLRVIQVLIGAYTTIGITIAFPSTVRLVLELLLTVTLWLVVLVTLLALWRYVESEDHLLGRITLWYPLTVALVVLPSVVVGIVSPSVRPWFLTVTGTMAAPIASSDLVTTLAPGFASSGAIPATIAYGAFWVGVVLVMGWFVGVLTEVAAWLPPRLAHLSALLWRRMRWFGRALFGDR